MTEHYLFEARLKDAWPVEKWSEVRTVVAVSGGADSVGLLRAITRIAPHRPNLIAAHLNHQLRGRESDLDQRFVEQLCRDLSVRLVAHRVPTREKPDTRIESESDARNKRYKFLRKTAESNGARYVLTAHTADDQAETILHNICRGTGLAGLAGIPPLRRMTEAVTLVRPMLGLWRSDVLSYLDQLGQTYRTDSSNATDLYTRNRIRRVVLPVIETEVNQSAREHLVQLAKIARDAADELDHAAERLEDAVLRRTRHELWLDREKLRQSSEFLIVHLLKRCWAVLGWPAGRMDSRRWTDAATAILSNEREAVFDLPGKIRCRVSDRGVKFTAECQS